MDAKEFFNHALEHATLAFRHLNPADYARPTPDAEWNARELGNHILYELSWVPHLLAGEKITDVGDRYDSDLLYADPQQKWDEAAALAKGSVMLANLHGTAHVSYGNVKNEKYLREVARDLLIHSWDLAAALGIDRSLDPETAKEAYDDLRPNAKFLASSGLFAPPLAIPKDADIQTKLLALVGRDAGWHPAV